MHSSFKKNLQNKQYSTFSGTPKTIQLKNKLLID